MNWIEIDKILYGIISRHDSVEGVIEEASKQFKWTQSQSEAAILPLLKRNTLKVKSVEIPKKQSKRSTKPK